MFIKKTKVLFVHIDKTGGVSIEHALRVYQKQHYSIQYYMDKINKNEWKNTFKFTFVRNPWSRMVSLYFHALKYCGLDSNITFKEYCISSFKEYDENPTHWSKPQLDWLTDEHGHVVVDFIGRYEYLREDFGSLCKLLDIKKRQLPHMSKTEHDHYEKYYDEELKTLVAEQYKKDIMYFSYNYGE